jgi:hypothetical protein
MRIGSLSNIDIVLYALFRLGGAEHKVHTEHIAVECFRLSKERFSWRLPEYRDLVDKELVRVALMDAAKNKYGRLAVGRSGIESVSKEVDGWSLTPSGAKWVVKQKDRIESALKVTPHESNRIDAVRFKRKLIEEPCYQKFLRNGSMKEVTQYEFTDMIGCSPDARPETIRKSFSRLRSRAEITGDLTILAFIDACRETFCDLMGPGND